MDCWMDDWVLQHRSACCLSSTCPCINPTSPNQKTPPADLAPLSLGKLTSLAEIDWVREEQQRCPALRYYYLGFYIHDCHRMRYKVGRRGVCMVGLARRLMYCTPDTS